MASLKALKLRIASVKSTQKITKAMKMVAAAKLRRAQTAAEAGRSYAEHLNGVIASLAGQQTGDGGSPLLVGNGKDQVHLIVVATSERGLAGAFATNIVRTARRKADELLASGKTVKFYLIGKKSRVLRRFYPNQILVDRDLAGIKTVSFADAKRFADDLLARFSAGDYDVAHLFFAKFRSALVQEPTEVQLIPVALSKDQPAKDRGAVVEYEPDEAAVLDALLPRNIAVQIFRALQENAASEEGSRMTAMDNATRNAGDMINRLSIQYNRSRQAAITTELVEIISGAEAL